MSVRAERDFFPLLGIAPLIGRTFDARDGDAVAVLAEQFWRRAFEGDPAIVGRTIVLDDRSLTVVGVMPERFQFPYASASLLPGTALQGRTDVWQPIEHALTVRGRFSRVLARLRPGVTLAGAEAELATLASRIQPAASLALRRATRLPDCAACRRRGRDVDQPAAVSAARRGGRRPRARLRQRRQSPAGAGHAAASRSRGARRSRRLARCGWYASSSRKAFCCRSPAAWPAWSWRGRPRAGCWPSAAAQVPRAEDVALDWRLFVFLFASLLGRRHPGRVGAGLDRLARATRGARSRAATAAPR